MHISEFIDPNEFQRFCSMLLSAEFPEFQSIDDSGGDLGIDGYIADDKIFQCYCPEKPQKITDKDFKDKIDDSIEKAVKTIRTRKLNIQTFVFVTPNNLRSDVIIHLEKQSKENSLKGISYAETKLAELLAKHPHVQTQFPLFVLPDIAAKLEGLEGLIKDVKYIKDGMFRTTMKTVDEPTRTSLFDKNPKLKESREAYDKGNYERFIDLSKQVYYETSDNEVKLQAILNIVLNDADPFKILYQITLCEEGIELSKRLKSLSTETILIAKKANLLEWEANFILQELWFSEQIAKQIGFFDEEEYIKKQGAYIEKLKTIDTLYQEAIQKAYGNKHYDALANIYLMAGAAAQTSYISAVKMRPASAGFYESRCKTAYSEAKKIFEKMGDREGELNVKHNLANALKIFGEKELSRKYAIEVLEEAKKNKFGMLELKAKELVYTIDNFTAEDYEVNPQEFLKKMEERRRKIRDSYKEAE